MRERLPENPPEKHENWQDIYQDIEKIVYDGNMHWGSANNFGYFCCGVSFPSMLGDLLSASTSAVGFTWVSAIVGYCSQVLT